LAGSGRREEEGRRPGAAKIAAARDPGGAEKGRGRKQGEGGLTGGTGASVAERKMKRPAAGGPLRGREEWAGAPKVKEVSLFVFFFFFFQTLFKLILFN
jgi:hypothetical protein